jgi:hypothetical protein
VGSVASLGRVGFPFHPRSCCVKLLVSPVILPVELAIGDLSGSVWLMVEIGDKDGTNLSLRLFLYFLLFEDGPPYNKLMLWEIFVTKGVGPREEVG